MEPRARWGGSGVPLGGARRTTTGGGGLWEQGMQQTPRKHCAVTQSAGKHKTRRLTACPRQARWLAEAAAAAGAAVAGQQREFTARVGPPAALASAWTAAHALEAGGGAAGRKSPQSPQGKNRGSPVGRLPQWPRTRSTSMDGAHARAHARVRSSSEQVHRGCRSRGGSVSERVTVGGWSPPLGRRRRRRHRLPCVAPSAPSSGSRMLACQNERRPQCAGCVAQEQLADITPNIQYNATT